MSRAAALLPIPPRDLPDAVPAFEVDDGQPAGVDIEERLVRGAARPSRSCSTTAWRRRPWPRPGRRHADRAALLLDAAVEGREAPG